MQVAPYAGDIMDAANSFVSGCLNYEPDGPGEQFSVKVKLTEPYGNAPTDGTGGRIILTTTPEGQSPAGVKCEYAVPGARKQDGCVDETFYTGVRRKIRFA